MSYANKNLMTGESIIYSSKLHWIVYLRAGFYLFLAIIFIPIYKVASKDMLGVWVYAILDGIVGLSIVFFHRGLLLFLAIIFIPLISGSTGVAPGVWIFTIFAGIEGLFVYFTRSSSEFAVTNKRVLIKIGIIGRHSFEILLKQVEGIGVNQGIFGGICGYGTIVVSGTGGTREIFNKVTGPLQFRKYIQEQIDAAQNT